MKTIIFILMTLGVFVSANSNSFEQSIIKSLENDKAQFESATKLYGEKRYKDTLNKLEEIVNNSNNTLVVLQSKLFYSSIVLDHYQQEKKRIEKAIDYIMPMVYQKKLPEYEFIAANLYFLNGDYDIADVFLQKACTSKNADSKIIQMCNTMPHINNANNTKDEECVSCSVKDKIESGDL